MRILELGRPVLAVVGGLLSTQAMAEDGVTLNSRITNSQLVEFCDGHEGDLVEASFILNGETIAGQVDCDEDVLAAAEAAIAAGLGAQLVAFPGEDEEEDDDDDDEDEDEDEGEDDDEEDDAEDDDGEDDELEDDDEEEDDEE